MKKQMIIVLGLAIIGSVLYGGNSVFAELEDQTVVHNYGSTDGNGITTAPPLVVNEKTQTPTKLLLVADLSWPKKGERAFRTVPAWCTLTDPVTIWKQGAVIDTSTSQGRKYKVEIINRDSEHPLYFKIGKMKGTVIAGGTYTDEVVLHQETWVGISGPRLSREITYRERGCLFWCCLFDRKGEEYYNGDGGAMKIWRITT